MTATANGVKGSLSVQASVAGVASPVVFSLTNVSISTEMDVQIVLPVYRSVIEENGVTHLQVRVGPAAGTQVPTGSVTFTSSRPVILLPGQSGMSQQGGSIVAQLVNGAADVEVNVIGWQSRTLPRRLHPR